MFKNGQKIKDLKGSGKEKKYKKLKINKERDCHNRWSLKFFKNKVYQN